MNIFRRALSRAPAAPTVHQSLTLPLLLLVFLNLLPSLYLKPWWAIGFAFALVSYRIWIEVRHAALPPRFVLLLAQLAAGAAVWAAYHSIFGDEAAGTLMMLLVALKSYELRHKRDYFICTLLAFLVLMSFLLLDQSLILTFFLFVDVTFLLAYLFALEEGRWTWAGGRSFARQGLFLAAKALPLMILVFILFPRFTTGFGEGRDTGARVGVSESLRPGSVAKLIASDELMFRATFLDGLIPPARTLYWRGAVLTVSRGLDWDRGDVSRRPAPRAIDQANVEVYLEPGNERLLFSLDNTRALTIPSDLTGARVGVRSGNVFELDRPLINRERYELYLSDGALTEPTTRPEANLSVKMRANADLNAEVEKLRRPNAGDTARAVLDYFRRGGFTYTLEPKPVTNLGDFLLKTKSGFCEHFAGAMATMLRMLDVPSRVVVGFQGGSPSLLENYVSVRSRDAHAWVEYFEATSGYWRRVDPTAEVEPQRITLGSSTYVAAPNRLAAFLLKGRALFDEFDARWTGFLVRFDLAKQQELLAHFGMEGVLFRALPVFLILAIVLVLAFLYFIEAQGRPPRSEADALYHHLVKRLRRLKIMKLPGEGPLRLLDRVARESPALVSVVEPLVSELNRVRYGRTQLTRARRRALRQQIRRLRRP